MRALNSDEIYGNWATLLLPLNADDGIDYPALEEEIEILISMKVNGIYSNGTAGEFYNQTEAEFDRVSQLLAEKCRSEEHMSELQSLMRISYAVFCLKNKHITDH